jgi:hypothetical protein
MLGQQRDRLSTLNAPTMKNEKSAALAKRSL